MHGSIAARLSYSNCLIIYDASQVIESPAVSSSLDLLASVTDSAAAHLYWMDPAAGALRLVSVCPVLEDGRIRRVSLQFSAMATPLILYSGEPGFDSFPETKAKEVSSLLAFPLRTEEKLCGMVTICRKEPRRYGAVEVESAAKLANALVAAVREVEREREVHALRAKLRVAQKENRLLGRQLEERKVVERAKGLLQVHYGWTEEDAYYHLRRTSRQQRTPMAAIAQRVIDVVAAKEAEDRMSA
jgi:GAF domain-containing protein